MICLVSWLMKKESEPQPEFTKICSWFSSFASCLTFPPNVYFKIIYFEALCFFSKHFEVAITSSKSQDYFPAKWASKNYHEHLDGGVSL